jgi:branched-chain amino acid transport system permease protein
MKYHREARIILLAMATSVAVAAGVRAAGDSYLVEVATTLAMWIALSESWILLSGMTGYISLGHVVFFGLGGYVTVLTFGVVPIWFSLCLSGLSAFILAVLVGLPCFRVRGP